MTIDESSMIALIDTYMGVASGLGYWAENVQEQLLVIIGMHTLHTCKLLYSIVDFLV